VNTQKINEIKKVGKLLQTNLRLKNLSIYEIIAQIRSIPKYL